MKNDHYSNHSQESPDVAMAELSSEGELDNLLSDEVISEWLMGLEEERKVNAAAG
ncbi:MAG TPA: hypothetical protein VK036_02425 [Wenzhouxiangella sp.]|nr:hypothetical protein [Wenzhouxiangella sp.]